MLTVKSGEKTLVSVRVPAYDNIKILYIHDACVI